MVDISKALKIIVILHYGETTVKPFPRGRTPSAGLKIVRLPEWFFNFKLWM